MRMKNQLHGLEGKINSSDFLIAEDSSGNQKSQWVSSKLCSVDLKAREELEPHKFVMKLG